MTWTKYIKYIGILAIGILLGWLLFGGSSNKEVEHNHNEVAETNQMILEDNLDVRTITMGISLLDCGATDLKTFNQKPSMNHKLCFGERPHFKTRHSG